MENHPAPPGEPLSAVDLARLLAHFVGKWSIELAAGNTWTAVRRRGSETRVVARRDIAELLGRLAEIEAAEPAEPEILTASPGSEFGGWRSGWCESGSPPCGGGR